MPKVAWEMGGVQKQVPLEKLAEEINALAKEH
jgi:two-component system chemotaxis response regulator CheB